VVDDIFNLVVPSIIAVSFFVFGFFVTADMLNLALREIVIGLLAGTVGGITTLVLVLYDLYVGQHVSSAS
jgi:hypothetical protein